MVKSNPSVESAATTARAISRKLRKAGFVMSQTVGKKATEGVYVCRVGYSNLVSVGYLRRSLFSSLRSEEEKARRDSTMDKVKAFLEERGYVIEQPNGRKTGFYIRCLAE